MHSSSAHVIQKELQVDYLQNTKDKCVTCIRIYLIIIRR